jgi:hypothetical protein
MGMLATVKAYRALSPQQKQLIKAKRVEGDYSPRYWLRLLGGPARFDSGSDRLRRRSGILALLSLVPVGIGLAFPPLLPVGLLLLTGGGSVWLITRRMDLSNRLRLFVLPLIDLLGDDVKNGRTLRLRLDLREAMSKDKLTGRLPPYKRGVYHKVVESHYEDPWLDWQAVLADGAHLQLQVHDSVRHFKRTKRTPRGKIKTKTKTKVRTRFEARLKLPVERYRVRELADDSKLRLQVKARSGEKWLSLHARRQVLGTQVDEPPLEPALDLITRLYQGVEALPAKEPGHA